MDRVRIGGAALLILLAVMAPAPRRAAAAGQPPSPAESGPGDGAEPAADDAGLYAEGTRAIGESRWQDAVSLFDRVARMRSGHAEGALYWRAYAENRAGRAADALSTCGELGRQYPGSRWLGECGALEIEVRGKSAAPVSPEAEADEDLKLLAVNALMGQDPAQAVPMLEKILSGSHTGELKRRALFVLAESPSPQADAAIRRIVEGGLGPRLQIDAIHMLAATMSRRIANQTLARMYADIYARSTDVNVKRAILQAYLMTGDASKVLEAARTETDPGLAREAIRTLGAMGGGPDLQALYRATASAEMRSEIIDALIPSGRSGAEALTAIAQSEQDAGLRRRAIRNLGVTGGISVAPVLVGIYQKGPDAETRHAAVEALFLASDAHDLVALARAEKSRELKRYLVERLALMHNQEATQYMLEILNRE